MHAKVLMGNSEGKRPTVRQRRRWKDNVEMYLQETRWQSLSRINVVWDTDKIQTIGRLLWTKQWNFGFCKIRSISELTEKLLATREERCFMELVLKIEDMRVRTEWIGGSHKTRKMFLASWATLEHGMLKLTVGRKQKLRVLPWPRD